MNTDLPDVIYVQPGKLGNDDLFVNRSPQGVNIGPGFMPGAKVGIYELKRVTSFGVGVVEIQPAAATTAVATAPVAAAAAPTAAAAPAANSQTT